MLTEKERIQAAQDLAKAKSFEVPALARKYGTKMAANRKDATTPVMTNKRKPTPTSAVRRTPYAYTGEDDTVQKAVSPRRKIAPMDLRGETFRGQAPEQFVDLEVDPRGSVAIPRRQMPGGTIPNYSARQVVPGVTEVISPGQNDQNRFFTNLIESGANPTQLRGFMERQRAQGTAGAEVSYEGPLADRGSSPAIARGPIGYNAVSRGERPGGVYSVGGRKRRGLGGLAAVAAEGRANKASAIVRQRDRELDISSRRAATEEGRLQKEMKDDTALNNMRQAQANLYQKQADTMLTKQEQTELQRVVKNDQNIASLYQQWQEAENETDKLHAYNVLQTYLGNMKYGLLSEAIEADPGYLGGWLFGIGSKEGKEAEYGFTPVAKKK